MYLSSREQTVAALAALIIVLLLACVLIFGLRVAWLPPAAEVLVSIDLRPREEPKKPPPQRIRPAASSAPKGAPAPPNLKNRATQVVAPPPPIVILQLPVAVATQPGTGSAVSTGASDRLGPGTGAGGVGSGNGGGGQGGDGDGRAVIGPRQIGGKLRFSDVPESMLGPGEQASVGVRFTVEANGRVSRCRITMTSRKAELDALVCRLIQRRFRFRPARDQDGRPVRADVVETHNWAVEPEAPRRGG